MPEWVPFVLPILTAAFAWGGAYMAVRVELRWLRSDVDDVHHDVHELAHRLGALERVTGPARPWDGVDRRRVRA